MTKDLISVIDDDESVRGATAFLIAAVGFRTATFESAEVFLKSGLISDTSCLIVDVKMPGMNGLQLQSELAGARCNIPVIFITAYNDEKSRKQAMQGGAVAFLSKPYNGEELLGIIHSALQENVDPAKELITVVDDDESVRRTTKFLIESFGFRAAVFESAEDFLESGQQHNTSCLILDVQMPNMNGLQLQSELAAANCSIPIVFITAYDDNESRGRAMRAGAVAFLAKPFNDEQLLQTVRSAIRRANRGATSM